MNKLTLSSGARRLLGKLQAADGKPGTNTLRRERNGDASPPTNLLFQTTGRGERKTIVEAALDSELNELSAAGLLSVTNATVELTELGRAASLDDLGAEASVPQETLSYTRRSYRVALIVAGLTLVGVGTAVLALLNGGNDDNAGPATSVSAPAPAPVSVAEAVRVDLQLNPDELRWPGPVGGAYLTPLPIEEVPDPPEGRNDCIGRYEWTRNLSAIDADSTNFEVQLTNTTEANLRITDIRVVVIESGAPMVATELTCQGGGATTERRTVAVDLDGKTLSVATANGQMISPDFTLEPTEFEVFAVTAQSAGCHCRWQLEFELLLDGEREVLVVDADGEPFQTSSSSNARQYQFSSGQWFDTSAGAAGVPLAEIAVPPEAGDTCRHLTEDQLVEAYGEGWTPVSGAGELVAESQMPSGAPMLAESCSYTRDSFVGVPPGLQLLRFADVGTAAVEASEILEQMSSQAGSRILDTPLNSEVTSLGDETRGSVAVVCDEIVVILQAPSEEGLVDLVVPVAQSVRPGC